MIKNMQMQFDQYLINDSCWKEYICKFEIIQFENRLLHFSVWQLWMIKNVQM